MHSNHLLSDRLLYLAKLIVNGNECNKCTFDIQPLILHVDIGQLETIEGVKFCDIPQGAQDLNDWN